MFWLFGTVKKYPEKNCNTNVVHFVPCGLSLTTACNSEQRSRRNWFYAIMQWSLILRLPLIEKKVVLQHNGEKSCFHLLFPDLEILCPIVMFILLPIISPTKIILKQFWCKFEKICCIVHARLRLWVKMASSSKYDMYCWFCPHTFPENNHHDHVYKQQSNFQQIFLCNVC